MYRTNRAAVEIVAVFLGDAVGWTVRGSISGWRKKLFLSSPERPDWLWGPLSLLLNGFFLTGYIGRSVMCRG